MPPLVRTRSYREFLIPALHKRFVSAAFVAAGVCYIEALLLGGHASYVWILFSSILRASLLFISALIIFLLRIAQLRLGARTASSPFDVFLHALADSHTYTTILAYQFSVWLFSETYIWSAPYEANLGWVAHGADYQRQELNERVVFLRCNTFIIALAQALIHLYYDYSYVPVPLPTLSSVGDVKGIARSKSRELSVSDQLKTKAWKMAVQIPISAVVLSCASLVTYIFIRPTAWSWSLSCARIVWDVADEPYPPVLPPYHYTVLGRTLQQSFLLITLWETCNTFFTLFVGQAPIKRGQVLTADSKDPNGSLITGLMARKDAVKTFALWELNIIVERFDARRKSILIELDRNGGSAWTQVFSECLDTINAINLRITEHQDPGSTIAAAHIAAPVAQPKIQTLLRIASPLREGQILTQSKPQDQFERYTQPAGSMMKSIGQAPPSQQFDLSPKVQRYFGKARDKVLSPEQQRAISKTNIHSSYQRHMAQLLRFKLNPLLPAYLNEHIPHLQPGLLFQETFARRMNCIVFGSPRGDLQILLYAIDVLVALSFASLTEDKYGVVSKDLPTIFRTLTATISNIEALLMSTPPHWTDVDFKDADGKGRKVKEIGTLLHHLKVGLTKLLGGFGGFASSLDLGPVDLRDARRAAGIEKA